MKWSTFILRLDISESKLVKRTPSGSIGLNLGSSVFQSSSYPSSSSQSQSSSSSSPSSSQSQSSSQSPSQSSQSSQSSSSSSSSSSFYQSSSSSSSLGSSSSSLIKLLFLKQLSKLTNRIDSIKQSVSHMNIYSIKEQGRALEEIGVAIDTPERLKLELALIKLSQLANADQLLFWGKINTTSTPYYIAVSIDFKGHYAFPYKKFYYSKDNFQFVELPALCEFNKDKANQINTLPFTGNPQTVLINCQPEGEQKKQQKVEQVDSDEEQVIKVEPKNYLEEDRLSYTVNSIQHECQLVPIGAFKMVTAHQIRYNEQFCGLNTLGFSLCQFVHFRYPQSERAKQKIESVEAVFSFDLFDSVQNSSYWSAQLNTTQTIGTTRSLLWPGYLSYCFMGRGNFGGVYVGNGLKQTELPFFV